MTEEKTDISLEERLAKRLAVRLPNYDDGREDVAWGIASGAAEDAHVLATFIGDWIEDMEDED